MAVVNCKICNKEYETCNTCASQKKYKPWRSIVDSVEHYKIYLAIHGYTILKDKEQAKKTLQGCDLSGLQTFRPEIKTVIEEIMAEPKKNKRTSIKNAKENKEVKIEMNESVSNDVKEDVE